MEILTLWSDKNRIWGKFSGFQFKSWLLNTSCGSKTLNYSFHPSTRAADTWANGNLALSDHFLYNVAFRISLLSLSSPTLDWHFSPSDSSRAWLSLFDCYWSGGVCFWFYVRATCVTVNERHVMFLYYILSFMWSTIFLLGKIFFPPNFFGI